jgi:hypothetical protein
MYCNMMIYNNSKMHLPTTHGILHAGFSGLRESVARK